MSQSSTIPIQCFLYFSEGQVRRDRKLGIMTNVGKNGLVKVISTNIHKISDACANGFGCIMTVQCMRNVFTLLNSSFSGKMVFLRKLKLIYPSTPSVTKIVQSPPFAFYWKNLLAPPPFIKEGRDYAFYMRDYKGETIKLLPFYMTDFLFTVIL